MPEPVLDAETILRRATPVASQEAHEIQPFGHLVRMPIALSEHACKESVENLNQLLADTMTLRDLYKKHHWQVAGPTFYQLHLLFDKHYGEQNDVVDTIAERIQLPGGVSVAIAHDVAETTELSTRTFCPSRANCRHCGGRLTSADRPHVLKGLSGVNEPPMIIRMTTSRRPQRRYDHRLRDLVHSTGDATIATDLGVPRSTARGWLRKAPRVAVRPGRDEPEDIGTPARNPGASATREDPASRGSRP